MVAAIEPPFLVALNLTRRCNLRCSHCYLDAGTLSAGAPDELSADEVLTLIDRIAALSDETMIVLTGGEPMLRPDLETLARRAADLGLMVVVGTNGTLLDGRRVAKLQAAGVRAVGISLEFSRPSLPRSFPRPAGRVAADIGGDGCLPARRLDVPNPFYGHRRQCSRDR